jgi:ribosomal protein S18 acetylase RimI-like enzyme
MVLFTNTLASKIALSHIYYPALISKTVRRPYGLLYHDEDYPSSHMCNHAVITDHSGDLGKIIEDITAFYTGRGLMPVLYTSFHRKAYDVLAEPLKSRGYAIGRYPDGSFFYYPKNVRPEGSYSSNVERVRRPGKEILSMFSDDDEGRYNRMVAEKLSSKPGYDLWVYCVRGKPVSAASFVVMNEFNTAVIDNVYTVPEYRNKGYATAVIRHALKEHRFRSDSLVFLYAYNEQAKRIYQKIGFKKIRLGRLEFWNAWLDKR